MIVKGTYYLGKYNTNYKTTICKDSSLDLLTKECEKIDDIWEGYVGLPRIGELFAVLQPSKFSTVYTLTPNFNKTSLDTFYLSGSRDNNSLPTELLAVKPTIFLSSNVTITSGEGTEKEPYEIVLAE